MSEWYWIIPLCFLIIGFFGMFWVMALSDVKVTIAINMDNNTLEAINRTLEFYEQTNLLNKSNLDYIHTNMNYTYVTCPIPVSVLESDYNLIIAKNGTCFYNGPFYEEEVTWNVK